MSTSVMMPARQNFGPKSNKAAAPATTSGSMKKQLRDVLRLLQRPNLPADVRREQERKLAALRVQADDRQVQEKERKMSKTYRMVRFFERKKAERRLKLAEASNSMAQVEEALKDLFYVLHFPKDRKYIALFPSTETSDAKVLNERRRIREEVCQEVMAKANVTSILEAPKPQMIGQGAPLESVAQAKTRQALNHGNKDDDEDDDDEEDFDEEGDDSDDDNDDEDGSDDEDDSNDLSDEDDSGSDDDEDDSDDEESDSDDDEDDSSDEDDSDEDDEDSDEDDSDEDDDDDDSAESFGSEDDDSDDEEPSSKRSRK